MDGGRAGTGSLAYFRARRRVFGLAMREAHVTLALRAGAVAAGGSKGNRLGDTLQATRGFKVGLTGTSDVGLFSTGRELQVDELMSRLGAGLLRSDAVVMRAVVYGERRLFCICHDEPWKGDRLKSGVASQQGRGACPRLQGLCSACAGLQHVQTVSELGVECCPRLACGFAANSDVHVSTWRGRAWGLPRRTNSERLTTVG
jgi:hypothetical protein